MGREAGDDFESGPAALIRVAREADAEAMLAIYAPVVRETPASFELVPPSLEEYRRRIASVLETMPWLVCEEGNEILGYTYASRFRPRPAYQWTAEVTVYVHPRRQRRAVGRALYAALFDGLRLQGYRSAVAVITVPNPGSVALHEAVGFLPAGVFRSVGYKLGRWHDVGFWQLALQELSASPGEPRAFPKLSDSAPFLAALDKASRIVSARR
jgi:phosphinothricin acetyltransferase